MSLTDFSAVRSAFANKRFARYTAGNAISLIGYLMQKLAVGWLAWQLTNSATWLGIIAFADLFPALLFGPLGGVIADRKSKSRLIMIFQASMAILALLFAFLAGMGLINIWLVFILTFLTGTAFALQDSARSAIILEFVPKEDVPTAVAISAIIFNTARFVGPALAGFAITFINMETAFVAHAFMALALLVVVKALALPPPAEQGLPTLNVARELKEGFDAARTHSAVAPMLVLFLSVTMFVRPVYELMPGVAAAIFERGAGGLSILMSAIGIGAIVAGIHMAQRGGTPNFVRLALIGAAGTAVCLVLFVMTPNFWFSLPFLFGLGYSMVICSASVQIIIQLFIDDSVRARVLSIWGVGIRGGPAIGTPLLGFIASYLGFRWPLLMGAITCLVISLFIFRRQRHMAAATNLEALKEQY